MILLLAYLTGWGLRLMSRQVERRLEKTTSDSERLDRLKTLVQLGRNVVYALVLLVAVLMILDTLQINIAPLVASAGVAGLAISLGAQTLIKDFIGGVLILAENQFTEGNVIQVGEISGTVERITLRVTYLRDLEGKLHVVPNGEIRLVSNLTSGWAQAVVDVNVPIEENIPKAVGALEAAASQAYADQAIRSDNTEPPKASGWVGFNDWSVELRLMARTKPGKQWSVAMELRRLIVDNMKASGVRPAFPSQTIRLEKEEWLPYAAA
ncbi:MAG: mechanosensitive ion channel family protein [Chloroflexota bacterium]